MNPGAFSQNQEYKSTIQDYLWHYVGLSARV